MRTASRGNQRRPRARPRLLLRVSCSPVRAGCGCGREITGLYWRVKEELSAFSSVPRHTTRWPRSCRRFCSGSSSQRWSGFVALVFIARHFCGAALPQRRPVELRHGARGHEQQPLRRLARRRDRGRLREREELCEGLPEPDPVHRILHRGEPLRDSAGDPELAGGIELAGMFRQAVASRRGTENWSDDTCTAP